MTHNQIYRALLILGKIDALHVLVDAVAVSPAVKRVLMEVIEVWDQERALVPRAETKSELLMRRKVENE